MVIAAGTAGQRLAANGAHRKLKGAGKRLNRTGNKRDTNQKPTKTRMRATIYSVEDIAE